MVLYADYDGATRDSDGEPCDSALDHGEAGFIPCEVWPWGHKPRHEGLDKDLNVVVTWEGGGIIAGDQVPVRDVQERPVTETDLVRHDEFLYGNDDSEPDHCGDGMPHRSHPHLGIQCTGTTLDEAAAEDERIRAEEEAAWEEYART